MTVYSYTWDTDNGLGCEVFATAEARDKALCQDLCAYDSDERIQFEDDKWPEFDALCDAEKWDEALTFAQDECLEIDGAHFRRDEHVI